MKIQDRVTSYERELEEAMEEYEKAKKELKSYNNDNQLADIADGEEEDVEELNDGSERCKEGIALDNRSNDGSADVSDGDIPEDAQFV